MTPAPAAIEVPAEGMWVPMDDLGGRPLVDVRINGKGPYRFIFDTGASLTVVDTALAEALELPAGGVHARTPSGGAAPKSVRLGEVQLGEARLEGVLAAVMPLGRMMPGENRPLGILSASAFPGHLVSIDYPQRRIGIVRGALGEADSLSVFQYRADEILPSLPVRLGGRELRVHLDSGSGYGLILPNKYLEQLPLATEPESIGVAKVHSGERPVRQARVEGPLWIGRYEFELGPVRFADLIPGFGEDHGNVGYELLRDFVVTLDSSNRRIRLQR